MDENDSKRENEKARERESERAREREREKENERGGELDFKPHQHQGWRHVEDRKEKIDPMLIHKVKNLLP